MAALEQAVAAAMNATDRRETLLVVTADHSHVLTLGGQRSPRGNPILGKSIIQLPDHEREC